METNLDAFGIYILLVIGSLALFAGSFIYFMIFGHVHKQVRNVKKAASLLTGINRKIPLSRRLLRASRHPV